MIPGISDYTLVLLVILCACIWLPILLHQMINRGFWVLVIWLLIAPVATNLARGYTNPFFGMEERYWAGNTSRASIEWWQNVEQDISLRELVAEPTRLLFSIFLGVLLLDALLLKTCIRPLDHTEKWMILFSLILLTNVVLLSRRVPFSLGIVSDAFVIPFSAYYVARRFVRDEVRFQKLLCMLGYLGLLLVMISLVERLVHTELLYRLRGPFLRAGEIGYHNVLVVIFFAVLSNSNLGLPHAQMQAMLPRGVRWMMLVLIPVITLLTWSRGNWIGFFLGAGIFFTLGCRLSSASRNVALFGLLLLSVPLVVLGAQLVLPEQVVEGRVAEAHTVYWRFERWAVTLREALHHPVFGVGLSNMKEILGLELGNIRTTHNSFLTFFAELGTVGLLAYLAVVTSIINTGFRLFRKGGSVRARWLGVAVIAVMIAHLMPAVFSDTIQRTRLWLIYPYVFVGSIAGLYRPLPSGSAVPFTPPPSAAVADPDARFLPMDPQLGSRE